MENKQEIKYYLGLIDEHDVPIGYDCYVWAGDFCVNGIEWCIRNGKKYQVLQCEELTYEDVHNIYIYLEKVKDKIISYLKEILNEYHKTDYSEFKWRILLNFWLAYFLPSIYDKFQILQKIKKDSRIFYVNLYEPDCVGVALDQLDFNNMLHDAFGFHKYEYSILLKHMPDITNIIVRNSEKYERMPLRLYHSELPEHVKSFVNEYREYKEKTNIQDEIVIQSPYIKFTLYKEIMEKKYGRISGYFLDYTNQVRGNLDSNIDLDVEWRTHEQYIADDEADEFVRLVYKMAGNFIPIAYLEQFDNLKAIALHNYKWGLSPKVVIFDCEGTAINELFKIYLMNIDVEHVLKVDFMHALSYGMGGFNWYSITEFQMCDEFWICGEALNNTFKTRFVRMPYINFFRMPNLKVDTSDKIIYANYAYPQHRGRLSMFEWNWNKYLKGELEFFKRLDQDVISELKIRMHPFHETQWQNKEKLMRCVPKAEFDEEPGFFQSICHAKLVISEVMGAAAFEAIAIGKPTVILYNPIGGYVELNDNYKDVEDLIRVGIIAETPEKLAELVNRIHNDVENWWNEPERQQVVRRIRDKYAYFPENAKEIWTSRIMSYINE